MDYPGRVVGQGERNAEVVASIVSRLALFGYPSPPGQTGYDAALASLVKLFQSQHVDALGRPLLADGQVGPLTWAVLFGAAPVTLRPAGLAGAALAIAISQVGVMEHPPGSNRGPEVDDFLTTAGAPPGSAWCMAFVHWCFMHAATNANVANPFPHSAGCLDVWHRVRSDAPQRIITAAQAVADPARVRAGLVFVLDHGGGHGHTGFVGQAVGGALRTVEGNSSATGSSEGVGVFDLNRRKVTEDDLLGFLDFTS